MVQQSHGSHGVLSRQDYFTNHNNLSTTIVADDINSTKDVTCHVHHSWVALDATRVEEFVVIFEVMSHELGACSDSVRLVN
jgi:hypothetical protein